MTGKLHDVMPRLMLAVAPKLLKSCREWQRLQARMVLINLHQVVHVHRTKLSMENELAINIRESLFEPNNVRRVRDVRADSHCRRLWRVALITSKIPCVYLYRHLSQNTDEGIVSSEGPRLEMKNMLDAQTGNVTSG